MGFFDFLTGHGNVPANGVRGGAQVVSCSSHHGEGIYQNCHMELVLQVPGFPAVATSFRGLVHRKHWPHPGAVLPVSVDPQNPHNFAVLWKELPDNRDRARATAQAMAAAMRGENVQPGGFPSGVQVVGDMSNLTEEQKGKLRRLGIDPDQLAAQQGHSGQPSAPPADDTVSKLERLAALRTPGFLTDAEFEQQKRRLLEG